MSLFVWMVALSYKNISSVFVVSFQVEFVPVFVPIKFTQDMMVSWYGNKFSILRGTTIGQLIPLIKASSVEVWCSLWFSLNKLLNKQSSW